VTATTRAVGRERADPGLERSIARLLSGGTYLAIALLVIGFGLMLANGISPLDTAPPFDVRQIPADILALRPTGFLWLGLIVVIATPSSRVVASLIGYARAGERPMVIVATAILVVIAISVIIANEMSA
jgi:uncharacterized membrane protein